MSSRLKDALAHQELGALRQALAGSGITLDSASICLLDPRRWVDPIPQKPGRTHDLDLLSAHQWQRYGKGVRYAPSAVRVLAMWRQRLQRLAEAAGDKTLLCLLAHSQPAHDGASTVFDSATRSQDAFSTPYPISADAFVTLAASVGLFCAEPPPFTRDQEGVCNRALYSLSRRDYTVRLARVTDVAALERLEKRCWIAPLRTPKRRLRARIERYPEGQFVLDRGGEVKGVIYSQRIRDESELRHRTMDDVHELHEADGDVVQLLAINIDPDTQHLGCGDQLLEFMLQRSSLQRGVRKIVAVTLCKDFRAGQGLAFQEYVTGPGREHDRVLHFHHAHGAEIASILPGYRPRDVANEGNGVLVAYDPTRRRPDRLARDTSAREVHAHYAHPSHGVDHGEVLGFVMEAIAALVGSSHAVDPERPLMESGLDSAGLLSLKSKLEARFGRHLKPSFFFSHSTPRRVVEFYCADTQVIGRGATAERASASVVEAAGIAGDIARDIAIVGVACRLPNGIHDLDALWDALDGRRDLISEYPASRGEWPRGGAIERGGFLVDGECFDPSFFRMSPREAEVTDPQQRLLLEVSWACFEDAGIPPATLRGTDAGVFVGASNNDYAHLLQEAGAEVAAHTAVGNSLAVLANRLSYFYDFGGPSLLIDTACSASMVALHTAVQSLRARDCGLALVGGVNFICNPRISLSYRKAGMLSSDGRCKVFDDSANGYVRSEGVVTLLLKPLGEAIADGNRVHAVIRGSAVNHGGQAAGLTVPNPQRQAALLTSAWHDARVSPRDITYLEAHGTGTSLGDPIEIEGMQSAFAAALPVSSSARCGVGSIKSNIGHLESAAGLAGVLKVVASMAHRRLPASIHVATLNSRMSLEGSPLHVQVEAQDWDAPGPRIAGVSSFGSGGANAHVVLQEHVAASPHVGAAIDDAFPDGQLFVLSAIDEAALRRSARSVLTWLRRRPASSRFVDAIYTWQCGRTAFKHRLAAHVRDFDDLARKLERWLDGGDHEVAFGKIDGDARGDDVRWSAALAQRDWPALARLWLRGSEGRWSDLYAGLPARPRFLSLPGHAFEKTRYWVSSSGTLAPSALSTDEHDVLFAVPAWRPLDDDAATDRPRADRPAFQQHVVMLCDLGVEVGALASAFHRIAPRADDRLCIALTASGRGAAERYEDITRQCFERLRELARDPSPGKVLVQCVISDDGEGQMCRGLSALLRTLAMERSRFVGQVVGVDASVDARTLATRLHALESRPGASLVRWHGERAEVLDWDRLEPRAHAGSVYRDGGVYVITGGLGALGRLFVADIVARCPRATVVLTGRSPQTDVITRQLEALCGGHTRLAYRQLDLQDAAAVSTLFEDVRTRYGTVHGVIHCAGRIADSLIVKKSSQEFEATLLPKVTGTWHLDLATRHLDLDFFVVFSSTTSALGNIGQADYAAANGFMDHFIHHRRELVRRGERNGASVSIHWPYWRDGGMRIDAATLAVLEQNIGMRPMSTEVGLSAFHMAVAMDLPRMLVAQGDPERFYARLRGGEAIPFATLPAPAERGAWSLDRIQKTLREMLADVLHAQPEDIELRKPLVELGLDSLLGTEFVSAINRRFSTALSSVGIYDHPNLMALAHYVDAAQPKHITPVAAVREPAARSGASEPRLAPDAGRQSLATQDSDEKIAVIGMSGRYPQAKNLDVYWRNLVAGRNAIVEIPDSRWETAAYYDADPDAEGKMYCRWMGVLDDADAFDPRFFRITPQEALYMDPEQRLFLQEGYRALEDAGYVGDIADGLNCGIYLGMESSDYSWHLADSPRVSETITGNHSAIAASRLAYFLNLKGPALAVDTACSSSLVATHLACQALRTGEVDLALAGGVRLWLSPVMHIGMSKARMLSPTGQCRTFDDSADGIVMSEGVGAVVLKRLSDAERDGDQIHGVILASGINQDGRTNGITAPSVKSQIALERRIYREHGIDPESISYIEAHGTGTKLGDPIELQALSTVFKERTRREQFCALGSVKTNIGHTAAAAGVASVHKVLLCLKHASLVPTLNVEKENRHFDFEHSPFYINREYKPWKSASGGKRRAGVSSFGFSGTNAHLVLEEYVPPVRQAGKQTTDGERLILLSARNAAQLEQRARDLLALVEHDPTANSGDDASVSNFLHALAHTLQVGRAPMEERAGFVAGSLDDLKAGLRTLGGQARDTVEVLRGRAMEDDGILGLWNTDEDLRATAAKWLRERRLSTLLGLWIKGVDFDWRELDGGARIARISLPTYPFAEERFWVDRRARASGPHAAHRVDRLHPLVHRNVSDLGRQAYRTTLSPRAFYVDDHRVNGARVLPGVAYLEMARAAVALALPEENTHAIEFLDHAWVQPVVVDADVELTIVLQDLGVDPGAGRRIEYEILTEADTGDTLHCRGSVRCHADAPEPGVVDLASLEDAIDGAGNHHAGHDRDTLYRRFAALGLHYGPSMQGIVDLRTDGREVLAHLRLPEGQGVGSEDFVLHPSMMDAAMQCTMCLLAGFDAGTATAVLPFTLDEMRVHAGTGREMLAWVRPSADAGSGASGKLDIDLMTTDGARCVSLRGLVERAIPQASAAAPAPRVVVRSAPVTDAKLTPRPSAKPSAKPTLRALLPIWNPVRFGADTVTPDEGERCLLLGGDETLLDWLRPALADLRQVRVTPDASIESIKTALSASSFDHLLWFAPDGGDTASIVSSQNRGVLALFRIIKALTQLDYHEREIKLTVVTFGTQQVEGGEPVSPHHAGVHGMIGSIAKELPLWRIRLLDLESTDDLAAREIVSLPWDEKGSGLAHRGGEWFRQEFAEVVRLPQGTPAGKHNGTYVVIGGAGGVGEVWTRHMVARYDANVVWIGRRPLDDGIEAKLDAIAAIGRRPHYIAADAADEAALASAIDRIRSHFPHINGVVHSALVLQDHSVLGMDEAVFRQSLVAKVDVSVNLEKVFRGHDLDFMLFFSSLSSFNRAAGQSNYCAGCTFKDSFAHGLRATQPYAVKIVNWGYWGSVGIAADEFYRKRMERLGLGSIEPEDAMDALERFMASEMNQLVLVDVIADVAFDDLPVTEEIRHYSNSKRSTNPSALSVAS